MTTSTERPNTPNNTGRRAFLKGMGGMAFCAAVGTDTIRLMSEAQAAAMARVT